MLNKSSWESEDSPVIISNGNTGKAYQLVYFNWSSLFTETPYATHRFQGLFFCSGLLLLHYNQLHSPIPPIVDFLVGPVRSPCTKPYKDSL
jgi:hypothetical protein